MTVRFRNIWQPQTALRITVHLAPQSAPAGTSTCHSCYHRQQTGELIGDQSVVEKLQKLPGGVSQRGRSGQEWIFAQYSNGLVDCDMESTIRCLQASARGGGAGKGDNRRDSHSCHRDAAFDSAVVISGIGPLPLLMQNGT